MAISEAQKRAMAKWRKPNQKSVGFALSVEQYELFRKYAERRGKTVTGMVKLLVLDCIKDMEQTSAAD